MIATKYYLVKYKECRQTIRTVAERARDKGGHSIRELGGRVMQRTGRNQHVESGIFHPSLAGLFYLSTITLNTTRTPSRDGGGVSVDCEGARQR